MPNTFTCVDHSEKYESRTGRVGPHHRDHGGREQHDTARRLVVQELGKRCASSGRCACGDGRSTVPQRDQRYIIQTG